MKSSFAVRGRFFSAIAAITFVVGGIAVAAAAPASAAVPGGAVTPAFTCQSGYYSYHVSRSADFLKVHKSPNSSTVYGQIPGGNQVCLNTFGASPVGGHYWDHGYGYNGSVKLTGYMADEYIVN